MYQDTLSGSRLALSNPCTLESAANHLYSLTSQRTFRHRPNLTLALMPNRPNNLSVEGFTSAVALTPDQSGDARSELLFWELKKGTWKPADSFTLICTEAGGGRYIPVETSRSGEVHPINSTASSTFNHPADDQITSMYSIADPSCPKSIRKAVLREAWKTWQFPKPDQCVLLSIQQWPEGEVITSYADSVVKGIMKPCTDLTKAKEFAHGVCAPSLITCKIIDEPEIPKDVSPEHMRSDNGQSPSSGSLLAKSKGFFSRHRK